MKLILFGLITICSFQIMANDGTNLLLKSDGEDIDVKSTIGTQKQLNFEDNFQIYLFGNWKAAGALSHDINSWVQSIFDKQYKSALEQVSIISKKVPRKFKRTFAVTKLYLTYKNDLGNIFLNKWLNMASTTNLLKSEIGLALDFVVAKNIGDWIIKNGFQFSAQQVRKLKDLELKESKINYSLQAWNAMRTGKNALSWVRKIDETNPIKIKLVNTILLEFAREGKLKASAKLIKEVFEPIVTKTEDTEEVAFYYLTLARLLYQAQAYDASKQYYYSIPNTSKYFLDARTEVLWSLLRKNDIGNVKGELISLKMDLFEGRFSPEIYLVSAIANIKTCQFEEVKNNFDLFLTRNKAWAKKIDENIKSNNPEFVANDFYLENAKRNLSQLKKEKSLLGSLESKYWSQELRELTSMQSWGEKQRINELKRRWKNRAKILDQAIYKMRFVKVEFISRMRELSLNLARRSDDSVTTYQSAAQKSNQIEFPADGMIWGDEVFSFTTQVENLCLKGLKK